MRIPDDLHAPGPGRSGNDGGYRRQRNEDQADRFPRPPAAGRRTRRHPRASARRGGISDRAAAQVLPGRGLLVSRGRLGRAQCRLPRGLPAQRRLSLPAMERDHRVSAGLQQPGLGRASHQGWHAVQRRRPQEGGAGRALDAVAQDPDQAPERQDPRDVLRHGGAQPVVRAHLPDQGIVCLRRAAALGGPGADLFRCGTGAADHRRQALLRL